MEFWSLYLKRIESKETCDWTITDLDKVVKKLKNNRARDPHDLVNEVFKPQIMGQDMKLALLHLLNQIKRDQVIPEKLLQANITSLYKK